MFPTKLWVLSNVCCRGVDDILAGKGKKKIGIRSKGGMFEELVKRINALVERLP